MKQNKLLLLLLVDTKICKGKILTAKLHAGSKAKAFNTVTPCGHTVFGSADFPIAGFYCVAQLIFHIISLH